MRSLLKTGLLIIMLSFFSQGCADVFKRSSSVEPEPQAAMLVQGEALLNEGKYDESRKKFNEVVKLKPSSKEARKAKYLIARSWELEGNEQKAVNEYSGFIRDYEANDELTQAFAYLRRIETSRYEASILLAQQKYSDLLDATGKLEKDVKKLTDVVNSGEIYLTIDTTRNIINIKMGIGTLHSFPVVTGKGRRMLKTTGKVRNFATPVGVYKVLNKEEDPVWYRPDWYWLEKGQEVPEDLTRADRAVPGVLGKYKIDLGNGIYIHGTRSGKIKSGNYSHGCMRLSADNLETAYNTVKKGTYVFIY